jgi:putative ABC transport system permease protein
MTPRSSRRRGPGALRMLLFRATLLGYPRAFRRTWSAELEATFAEAWAAESQGAASALRFWRHLLYDGLVNGARARLATPDAAPRPATERTREPVMIALMQGFVQDIRLTLRSLRRQRASAFAVVITLALGIGAATAIFSVVDAVLLRPLPFAEPDRLVELQRKFARGGVINSYPVEPARGIIAESDVFESIAATARIDGVLTGYGDPRSLRVRAASAALFDVLGRAPAMGRGFTPQELRDGARVMLLSHETWNALGRERGIIGRTLEFDGDRYEVIGVMPSDFRFPTVFAAHAFIPLTPAYTGAGLEQGSVNLVARLRTGVTPEAASERTAALVGRLLDHDVASAPWTAAVSSIGEWRMNREPKKALLLVAGAVALMLLIAIMNATNLLLARVTIRAREFGIRHSLGAARGRIIRQLGTESLILALLAGGAAVLLAVAGVRVLMRFAPPDLTELAAHRIAIDDRVLLFTFVTTVGVGFLLGVMPALSAAGAARRRISAALSAYAASTRERHRARGVLVIAQVALAMTLLVGAGLLALSFTRIMSVDAGLDTDRLAIVQIEPNERAYPTPDARRAFAAQLEERIAALPGVEAVTRAGGGLPPSGAFGFGIQLQTEDDAEPRDNSPELLPFISVRPDFLETVGARLVGGRNFNAADRRESNVVIIDRDFAQYLWGSQPAVGRRFRIGPDSPWLEVVGVVDEIMLGGPNNATGEFAMLYPASPNLSSAFYAVRARGDAASVIQPIREAIRAVDANQPVWQLLTMRAAIADEVTEQRFFMMLMVVLGAVSLVLAALGLYGLLSFAVSRRTRELGIRMALGARAATVLRLVVVQGMWLAVIGVALGLIGALAGARLIESLLFDVRPDHPLALGAIAAVMLAVALLAAAVPALRAARVEPMRVLREE